ncbi:MAG: NCS2 family permease [Coprobacillus sp.]|nr:NCS2 family permease [Coprobacillus sp.]
MKTGVMERLFHVKERGSSLKTEIIAGLVTFASVCYILPVNASILSDAGMSSSGVFMATALVAFVVTMIMGLVANYPIVLSAGMGLNAFFAYNICLSQGFNWQEGMILLTVSGIIFFVLSLTPVRRWIIDAIPKNIRYIISAALGLFIAFVGLKNAGIIVSDESTIVSLASFVDPAIIIGVVGIIVCLGLMLSKNKICKNFAIPFSIIGVAVVGLILSTIFIESDMLTYSDGSFIYTSKYVSNLVGSSSKLPIWPGYDSSVKWADFSGFTSVLFYGSLGEDSVNFGQACANVFSSPVSYIGMFSLIFVNLFDTTATLTAVGEGAGMIDENGKLKNYRRAMLADATGALICAPLGTSTTTSFAESNVGVSMGAKTGLSACTAGLCFLLCMFIYPVFSIFTAGSVTAPALVCVGGLIFVNNIKQIDFKSGVIGFTAFITLIFTLLTYSITIGIGLGLICYCVMMLCSKQAKEVGTAIYVIACLFLVYFILDAVLLLI